MKLNYLVDINIAELCFNGPKITHSAKNFYESKKYEYFKEKVLK